MKGYTEDEIEDFLAKIEDVNKKVFISTNLMCSRLKT